MEDNQEHTKKCPFCAEIIHADAIKCRFCNEFLQPDRIKAMKAECNPDSQDPHQQNSDTTVLFRARPSLWGLTGSVIRALLLCALAAFLIYYPLEQLELFNLSDAQALTVGRYRVILAIGLIILAALVLLLKTLRLKMTRYAVTLDRIEWSRGILNRKVDNLDMFRVIDLKLRRSFLDCLLGIGTVALITTDKSDPQFTFQKVHNCRRLYDIIKKASLDADQRRSVFHLE